MRNTSLSPLAYHHEGGRANSLGSTLNTYLIPTQNNEPAKTPDRYGCKSLATALHQLTHRRPHTVFCSTRYSGGARLAACSATHCSANRDTSVIGIAANTTMLLRIHTATKTMTNGHRKKNLDMTLLLRTYGVKPRGRPLAFPSTS